MRKLVFEDNTYDIRATTCKKRGRPRLEWSTEFSKMVQGMLTDTANKEEYFMNADLWRRKVWQFTELLKEF